ncbi:MAG: T9SS type A sorting domain-containing protein [Bacteroidales bacterium]|nr:T9SS type A sorting domain-containing protein [Bacteroidales bacterium]
MKTLIPILPCLALMIMTLPDKAFPQGKLKNDNAFIKGSANSYIKFNGNNDMTLIAKNAGSTELGNVVADFTGNPIHKLIIPDDSYITVKGNLVLWDTLLLEAGSTGMASLITHGSVNGNYARVEQHFPAQDEWHIISSPVASATANVYAGCYLLRWYEPDSSWTFITSTAYPLTPTRGFFAWSSSGIGSPVDVVFDGTLNTGNKAATVTYNNGPGKGDGWNLLGNPYPSALEWNSSWTKSNIDATVYVYNGTQYLTWNYNLGGYGTKTDGAIPSTQGFWVRANAAAPSITIPNTGRIHSAQSFYKASDPTADILNIQVTGNGYSDNALIGFYTDATDLFDPEYDAYKIKGIYAAPQLYSVMHADEMAVNILAEMASDKQQKTVPVSLEVGQAETYTFSFSGAGGFEQGISIFLEDRYSSGFGTSGSKLIDIRNTPQYSFYARPEDDPARFFLHFNLKTEKPNEGTSDDFTGETVIYAFEKNVYVMIKNTSARVTILDLLGKKMLSEYISADLLHTFRLNSPTGYYIVNVINNEGLQSGKVFIR